ncbi:hypothetical protein LZ554_007598 [Drepanopeziza brunnea f. sp. 'monogermtubi']|nr:hypothetical protein LZ554_007598 [Drepanopeziza brunnea f. sp. 'monogermtubi']
MCRHSGPRLPQCVDTSVACVTGPALNLISCGDQTLEGIGGYSRAGGEVNRAFLKSTTDPLDRMIDDDIRPAKLVRETREAVLASAAFGDGSIDKAAFEIFAKRAEQFEHMTIDSKNRERQLLEKYKADLREEDRLGAIQSHKNWIISATKLRRRLDSVQNSAEGGVQRVPDTDVLVIIEVLRRACRDRAKLLGPEGEQQLEGEICAPSCAREAHIQEIHRRIRN